MKGSRRQGLSLAVDCCGQTERWTRDEMKLPHLLTEGEVVGEGATPSTPLPPQPRYDKPTAKTDQWRSDRSRDPITH